MGARLPNPRRFKVHRNYTAEEIADICGVHKNTVREWTRHGLRTCNDVRPKLYHGRDVREFLELKRRKNKRPCGPTEFYCFRCRRPRTAWGGMADFRLMAATSGMLTAFCHECEELMYRRASLAGLAEIRPQLQITIQHAHSRLSKTMPPFVNSAFEPGVPT